MFFLHPEVLFCMLSSYNLIVYALLHIYHINFITLFFYSKKRLLANCHLSFVIVMPVL